MTLVEWLESIQHKINNFESVNFATAFGGKIDMMITHIREKDARIAELEAQVRNLRRQREIDEAYTEEVNNSMSELLEDHEEEVSRLNARIAELEAQLSEVRAEYQKVTVWLAQSNQLQDEYKARITELEAEVKRLRELVYLAHADDCTCKICTDARMPNPIICCICGQPITGIEIDHRFWLHRIGCNGGECDCDLECHDECYDGHEHEYAPFDDEDDE